MGYSSNLFLSQKQQGDGEENITTKANTISRSCRVTFPQDPSPQFTTQSIVLLHDMGYGEPKCWTITE